MIQKQGSGFVVKSHKGKNLSKVFKSRKSASKRLREIEYFKHKDKDRDE